MIQPSFLRRRNYERELCQIVFFGIVLILKLSDLFSAVAKNAFLTSYSLACSKLSSCSRAFFMCSNCLVYC